MRLKYLILIFSSLFLFQCSSITTNTDSYAVPAEYNAPEFDIAKAYIELSYMTRDILRVQAFIDGKPDKELQEWANYWGPVTSNIVLEKYVQTEFAGK